MARVASGSLNRKLLFVFICRNSADLCPTIHSFLLFPVYFRTLLIAVIFALAIAADHVDESHVADQSPPSSSSPQPTETEHSIELHSVESTASSSSNFNPSASQSELSVAVDATGALQDASSTPSESLSVSENSVSEPEVSVPEVPAPVEEGSGVELPSENPPQPQPVEHHSTVEQHQPPEHQSSIEQSADTDHSLVEATEASSIQDSPPPSQTAESSVISSEAPAEHIVPDEQVVPAEQTVPATDATSEPPAPAEPIETDTVDAVQSQSIDAENSGFAMPRVTEQPIEVPTSAVNGDESSQTPIEPQPVEGENASESNPSGNEVSSGELPAEEVSSASSAVDASQNSNATAVAQEMNTILNEAEDALYRGDLAAAAAAYERLIAKHRTPEAHFGLGEMLLYVGDGYSSPNNSSVTDRALLNLKAAAELGDSHAQALLSTLHALGAGVKHDEALAVLYAYFAALGDSASAKLTMAYRHLHGLGVPQVCVTAAAYYQELAQNVIEKLEVESQSVRGGGQATDGAVIERQRLSDAKSRDSGVSDTINRWLNSVLGEEKLDIDAGAVAGEGQAAAHNGRIPGGAAGAYRNLRGGAGGRQVLPAGGEAAGAEAAALPDAALPGGQDEIHDVPEEVAVDDDGHALEANVVMYYRQAALQGDVNAQVAMGQLHYHGFRGVPRDLAKAASYFQMAVDRGDATAHAMLGQMYLQGVGVPQNNETAFNLFTKGAAKKAVAAMNGLGYMYLNGIGTAVNTSQALRWFKSAAENGNADAQFNLGSIYFGGLSGVAVDAGAALRYFALAAQQGHTRSIYNLAQMHLHGMATPKCVRISVHFLWIFLFSICSVSTGVALSLSNC
jgi:TPR repeat protein